jgi:G3E family GTPase
MSYTHYFKHPIDSEKFEQLVAVLPENVFRAKGILRFTDTVDPFLFQYAYREMEFVRITPREQLPNVVVFIGERFSKESIMEALSHLNY